MVLKRSSFVYAMLLCIMTTAFAIFAQSETSQTTGLGETQLQKPSDFFDGNLPLGGIFYGNYEYGFHTGNASIGYESSRRFRAERSGFIDAIRYNNRTLSQVDITHRCKNGNSTSVWCNCIEAGIDQNACGYTLSNSYSVGNGGEIIIEIHSDDNGLPSGEALGRTSGVFIPQENSSEHYPVLTLEKAVNLLAGSIYHLVYKNLAPPSECSLSKMSTNLAKHCNRDQGAIGLNGISIASNGGVSGFIDPFRGNSPANFFKAEKDGEWLKDTNNISWYEVRYTDKIWIGDSHTAFGATSNGLHRIKGDTLGRQVFDVEQEDRIATGIWLNFGHSSDANDSEELLKILVNDAKGNTLSVGYIKSSANCKKMAKNAEKSRNAMDLHCREWGYTRLNKNVNLEVGNRYAIVLQGEINGSFLISTSFPLNYGTWLSKSRNHWNNARAEISHDNGKKWTTWANRFPDRDMSILFTLKDKPVSLH